MKNKQERARPIQFRGAAQERSLASLQVVSWKVRHHPHNSRTHTKTFHGNARGNMQKMENIIVKVCYLLRVPLLRLFEDVVAGSLFFYHYLHLQQQRKNARLGRLLHRRLSDNSRAINNAMFVLLRSVVQCCTLSVHFPSPLHTADTGLRNQLSKRLRPF